MGKCACCQVWRPEFNFWDPHGRRELTSRSYPLTSACTLWYAYTTPVHIKSNEKKKKLPYDREIPLLGINYAYFAGPQQPRYGTNLGVYQWMSKENVFYMYLDIIQLLKRS